MIQKREFVFLFATAFALCFCGCATKKDNAAPEPSEPQIVVSRDEIDIQPENPENNDIDMYEEESLGELPEEEPQILVFRDVFGEEYQTQIDPSVPSNKYSKDKYRHDGDKLIYDDKEYDCILGVDVSHHQGSVDWKSVKDQGYDFAFLRIGYRGYGNEGSLNPDRTFEKNYENARSSGLSVGVYFFAQAISEEEAIEEAEYVLKILNGRELELPVVYDPESILDDEARTDDVTAEQFTKNSRVFCNTIKENGYKPMIYSNMLWEAFQLDLGELTDIPIWYADYEEVPQTPYDFEFWQYSNEGNVKGINGVADLDIWMKPRN